MAHGGGYWYTPVSAILLPNTYYSRVAYMFLAIVVSLTGSRHLFGYLACCASLFVHISIFPPLLYIDTRRCVLPLQYRGKNNRMFRCITLYYVLWLRVHTHETMHRKIR